MDLIRHLHVALPTDTSQNARQEVDKGLDDDLPPLELSDDSQEFVGNKEIQVLNTIYNTSANDDDDDDEDLPPLDEDETTDGNQENMGSTSSDEDLPNLESSPRVDQKKILEEEKQSEYASPRTQQLRSILRYGSTNSIKQKQVRFAPISYTEGVTSPDFDSPLPMKERPKAHFMEDADGNLTPNKMGLTLEEKSLPRPFTPSFRLDGRVAIVTGGSRGLGFAIALGLACMGASVLITSRTELECRDAARKITSISGGKCVHLKADVSKESENRRTINKALVEFRRLDILINNAAIGVPIGKNASSENFDSTLFQLQMSVNITGAFLLSRLAIPHIAKSSHGRIVNISSMQGNTGNPGTGGAYPLAKKALEEMTRVLARELGPTVTVNCVAPGLIKTRMSKRCWSADQIDQFVKTIPSQRIGSLKEVVNAVMFYVSDMASFITGTVLPVDGGMGLH